MPRMQILSVSEQTRLERPPAFDSAERKRFFEFPVSLLAMAVRIRDPSNRIGFLVSCGYFRASRRFFQPRDFDVRNIMFVASRLGLSSLDFDVERYSRPTRSRHQRAILNFYGFRSFDRQAEASLVDEIAKMARTHLKPKLIFEQGAGNLLEALTH